MPNHWKMLKLFTITNFAFTSINNEKKGYWISKFTAFEKILPGEVVFLFCEDVPGTICQISVWLLRYVLRDAAPSNFCCWVWHSNRLSTIILLERCGLEWPSSQVFLLRSANICVRFLSSRSCALLFSPLATFYSKNPLIFSKQPPPLASTRPNRLI